MNDLDKKVLSELQKGLKLETRPFLRIARKYDITENDVISIIKNSIETGIMRRMGVGFRPSKVGFKFNALLAIEVKPELIESVGNKLSKLEAVSHCYERECPEGWCYNMFAMVHTQDEIELLDIIEDLKKSFNITNYKIFKTEKELKKTSVRYFNE